MAATPVLWTRRPLHLAFDVIAMCALYGYAQPRQPGDVNVGSNGVAELGEG